MYHELKQVCEASFRNPAAYLHGFLSSPPRSLFSTPTSSNKTPLLVGINVMHRILWITIFTFSHEVGRFNPCRGERGVEIDQAASESHGDQAQSVTRRRQAASCGFQKGSLCYCIRYFLRLNQSDIFFRTNRPYPSKVRRWPTWRVWFPRSSLSSPARTRS